MYILAVVTGVSAGIFSGLIGIGGGVIIIPSLVFFMGFSQHLSQGTALVAMLPPIGLLAAIQYYRSDYVNLPVALLLSAGFIFGAWAGAKIAMPVDDTLLRKIFGIVLLAVSVRMIIGK